MRVLFATSEIYPLVKTGGLADVAAGLTTALQQQNHEVTVILPAYQEAMRHLDSICELAHFSIHCCSTEYNVRLLRADSDSGVTLLLVDIPGLFDRPGNPYLAEDGTDWWDNGERFGLFSRIAAGVALNQYGLGWRPDVVHCNDWQTGLLPAFMRLLNTDAGSSSETDVDVRLGLPRTIFTVHNLSYAGKFSHALFAGLGLPDAWWSPEMLEFYGAFSMLKGGIVCADYVTTVSPTYAEEICTPPHGFGFEGLLRECAAQGRLSGILNGIDTQVWNPATDRYIPYTYSVQKGRVAQKERNKNHLLKTVVAADVKVDGSAPLLSFIGRMVEQKGIDLLIEAIPALLDETNVNIVILGSGQKNYEHEILNLARLHPHRVFVHIGYSEELAHLIEAGADIFLMPSRFEPCGLNQMYSLAYGTLPIVHATGGLKDTVIDASAENIATGTATGFVMLNASADELRRCCITALELYRKPRTWQKLQKTAMSQDFGWQRSATSYQNLYKA
ncbi:MAG: glycogen synthase GlgA [Desulfuromonadaceae bacterium]|nr:glycogen synthase GlgA [Desulfuromonas sp.]MDY0184520.1 glycogen synthase GlgA [Desulfuromonadaceae bacterium]